MHIPQNLKERFSSLGITELNPMQIALIEKYKLNGFQQLLAPTGSGKTLAFLLAILNNNINRSVIIAPSRELCLQIQTVIKTFGFGVNTTALYGGHRIDYERLQLSAKPDWIVATPGRLLHHIEEKSLNYFSDYNLVLDEFDKMLEMGFHDDLQSILNVLGRPNSAILASATTIKLPEFIRFANYNITDYRSQTENKKLNTYLVETNDDEKVIRLARLLQSIGNEATLIFCNHREAVERIFAHTQDMNIHSLMYHGGMEQFEREKALIQFRNKSANILVCTDLASRGLDIPEIKNIIHYQLPREHAAYIHRNGRTARMFADGNAYVIKAESDSLPEFIDTFNSISLDVLPTLIDTDLMPKYTTVCISLGRRQKVSKGDILGFFTKQLNLDSASIGKIEIVDAYTFMAIGSALVPLTIELCKGKKIKGKSFKIFEEKKQSLTQ